jgi:hypothetical protein
VSAAARESVRSSSAHCTTTLPVICG